MSSEFFRAVLCGELFAEQTQYLQVADLAFDQCDGGAQCLATLQHAARVARAQLSARTGADGDGDGDGWMIEVNTSEMVNNRVVERQLYL